MTLEEAIKLLLELRSLLPEVGFNKYIACVNCGLNALEEVLELHSPATMEDINELPGETHGHS